MSCTSCVLIKSGPNNWLIDSRTNVLNCLCCLLRLAVVSGAVLIVVGGADVVVVVEVVDDDKLFVFVSIPASCIFDSFDWLVLFGDDFMVADEEFDWNDKRDLRVVLRLAFVVAFETVSSVNGSF